MEVVAKSSQLTYIRQSLNDFREGKTSLQRLVEDVQLSIEAMKDEKLREQLHSEWWTLEQVYAVALDRGDLEMLPPESAAAIEEAITALMAVSGRTSFAVDRR